MMTYTLRYSSRVLVGLGLAGLLVISQAVPAFSTETTITVTIIGGPRTVTVDASFVAPDVMYLEEPQTSSGSVTLIVNDSSGTGDGWHVALQATDMRYSGLDSDASIPAGNLTVVAAEAPVMLAGQPVDPTNGPLAPRSSATGSLDQPRIVLTTNPDYGMGRYSQTLDLTVTIPAMTQAGNYSGALIVSIVAGP